MKNLTKTLIAASLVCLIAGQSSAYAQFRSGKSSKGSSRGFSSSRNSSSGSSRNSGSRIFSGSKPSISKFGTPSRTGSSSASGKTGGFGKFTPAKPSFGKGSSSISTSKPSNGRGFGTITKPTLKPNFGNSQTSKLPGLSNRPGSNISIGKTPPLTTRPSRKVPVFGGSWLPGGKGNSGRIPTIGKPSSRGSRLPVPPNTHSGNNGSRHANSGGKHQTTKVNLRHGWQHAVQNILHNNRSHWCHTRPAKCRWWVSYCEPISHCHAHEIVVCDWSRVQCAPVVHGNVQVQEVQWYLGMKGMLLPGKGIGIEGVEPGSPAEQVGLRPGMVMTVANGIPLVDETSMQEAIRISGGVLQMTLLSEDGSQVLEGVVQMVQVAAVSF